MSYLQGNWGEGEDENRRRMTRMNSPEFIKWIGEDVFEVLRLLLVERFSLLLAGQFSVLYCGHYTAKGLYPSDILGLIRTWRKLFWSGVDRKHMLRFKYSDESTVQQLLVQYLFTSQNISNLHYIFSSAPILMHT